MTTTTPPGPRQSTTDDAALIDAAARDLVDRLLETVNQLHDPVDRAAGAIRYRDVVRRAVELLGLTAAINMRDANRAGRSHQAIADQLRTRAVDMGKSGVGYWISQADAYSPAAHSDADAAQPK